MASVPEAYALAVRHHREGRLHDAEPLYRQIIKADPGHGGAWYHLGVISNQLCNPRAAVECFERAVAASPTLAEGHHQLGSALSLQGKHDNAIACYQRAIELKPHFPEAYNDLGLAFRERGKLQEAAECYRHALELRPEFVDAYNNLGNVLKHVGRLDQAMAYFRRALKFNPNFAEAHNNLGIVLKERGKLDESMACFQRALELKPDFEVSHSNYLYTNQYRHGITLAELATLHGEYDRRHAEPLRPFRPLHENNRNPDRRLRLGFVSRDFGRHPVGFFLIRLLENLERDLCEIICYSDRTYNDSLAARFHAAATLWREVGVMDHAKLAETIRTDRIDVLFDLGGHTAHNRLLVFARKPAPVQITWLGYEGTTGLEAMDYILADASTIPHEHETWFRELVLRMPAAYVCYDPPEIAPEVTPLPAASNGFVRFGSFNNLAKITPQVVEVWRNFSRECRARGSSSSTAGSMSSRSAGVSWPCSHGRESTHRGSNYYLQAPTPSTSPPTMMSTSPSIPSRSAAA